MKATPEREPGVSRSSHSFSRVPSATRRRTDSSRIEELEIALQTAQQVNAHLNAEVEKLVLEADGLRKEKEAAERHAQDLALLLAKERRSQVATSEVTDAEATALTRLEDTAASAVEGNGDVNSFREGNGASWVNGAQWENLRSLGAMAGWLVDPSEVTLGAVLGEGTFGTTHRGTWRGGDIAVKCVRIRSADEAASFLREAHILALLRHPHIMPFYGACLKPPGQCWLLCEYLPGGPLSTWLHGTRKDGRWPPKRSLEERVRMALEVARGMQALEEAQPPILHRDLKPSNVLLDAAGRARVADMGLARRLAPDGGHAQLTGETGTYLYMAPEVIRHEDYDSKADVFSWGVMLAELLGQRTPYEELLMTPVQVALAVADDKLRPALPPGTPSHLASLAESCFDAEPGLRPSFAYIVEVLQLILPKLKGRGAPAAAAAAGAPAGAPSPQPAENVFSRFLKKPTFAVPSFMENVRAAGWGVYGGGGGHD